MRGCISKLASAFGALLLLVPLAHAQQPKLEPLPPPEPAPLPPPAASSAAPSRSDFGVAGDAGAPPSAPGPTDAPPVLPPKPPSGNAFRPTFKGAAGFQYAQVHGVPITGGRLRLGVGGQNDSSAFYAMLSMLYGSTEESLRTWDVRGTISADLLRVGLLRLGGDLEMGYLVVRRATVDSRMWALGLGAGIHASVDVYQFGPRDDHAIFVEGKLDAHLHFGSAFMWGPSVLAGVRY